MERRVRRTVADGEHERPKSRALEVRQRNGSLRARAGPARARESALVCGRCCSLTSLPGGSVEKEKVVFYCPDLPDARSRPYRKPKMPPRKSLRPPTRDPPRASVRAPGQPPSQRPRRPSRHRQAEATCTPSKTSQHRLSSLCLPRRRAYEEPHSDRKPIDPVGFSQELPTLCTRIGRSMLACRWRAV